jgi:hypothetical protein
MLAKEAKGRMSRGAKLSIVKGVANLPHPIDGESPDGESVAPVSDDERGRTREKLAEMAGVSPRLVQDAKLVQEESPEMFEKVKAGDVTVHGALKTIKDGKAGGTAGKPAVSDDPVTKFLSATKLAVKAAESVCKSPPEGGFPNGLAEAINSLGFAYSQLLPVLARSGDSDAMEMARRTIAQLAAMKLGTGP